MADNSARRWPASTLTHPEHETQDIHHDSQPHFGDGFLNRNQQAMRSNSFGDQNPAEPSPDDFYKGKNGNDTPSTTSFQNTSPEPLYQIPNGIGTSSRNLSQQNAFTANGLHIAKRTESPHTAARSRQPSGTIQERLKLFEGRSNTPPPKVPGKIPVPRNASNSLNSVRERTISESRIAQTWRPGDVTRSTQGRTNSPTASRTTQRNKFVAEDQHSNNSLSSIARGHNVRSLESKTQGRYQDVPNRGVASQPLASSDRDPKPSARQPLFGEVIQSSISGDVQPGFGIPDVQPRSSVEAVQVQPDDQASGPSSPTDWYRQEPSTNNDLAGLDSSVSTSRSRSYSASMSQRDGSANVMALPKYNAPSRLPVMANRRSLGSSGSTSMTSSRASSPQLPRASSALASRKQEQRPFSPPARAIGLDNTPPTRKGRSPSRNGKQNGGVTAYIQETSPRKDSPQLRTSRDRSSVAVATTASSRSRAVQKSSPYAEARTGRSPAIEGANSKSKAGPIDYGASRARVKQGMRERIEETRRQRAVRDQELLQARHESELAPVIYKGTDDDAQTDNDLSTNTSMAASRKDIVRLDLIQSSDSGDLNGEDSPTLGIPGAFPCTPGVRDEDATSGVSDMTEFDAETQIDAPSDFTASTRHEVDSSSSTPVKDDNESIKIMLFKASPKEHLVTESQSDHPTTSQLYTLDEGRQSTIKDPSPSNEPPERIAAANSVDYRLPTITDIPSYRSYLDSTNDSSPQREPNSDQPIVYPSQHTALPRLHTLTVPTLPGETLDTPATVFEENVDEYNGDPSLSHIGGSSLFSQQLERLSQQSSWTDYSVHSIDGRHVYDADATEPLATYSSHPEYAPPPPPKPNSTSSRPAVPPKPADYSPQPSPQGHAHIYNSNARLSTHSHASYGSSHQNISRQGSISHTTTDIQNSDTASLSSRRSPSAKRFADSQSYIEVDSSIQTHGKQKVSPPAEEQASDEIVRSVSTGRKQPAANVNGERQNQFTMGRPTGPSVSLPAQPSASAAVNEQSADFRLSASHSVYTEDQKEHFVQRLWAVKELIDSEALFLKDMHVFEEIYKGTAEVCPTLTEEHVDLLFRNIGGLVAFTTTFLADLKIGASSIYSPRSKKDSRAASEDSENYKKFKQDLTDDYELRDRQTTIAAAIEQNMANYQIVYTTFLSRQMQAAALLQSLKGDLAVDCWLGECNQVAKDLTAAWDIDSLWSKPLQRLSKLPLLVMSILKHTPVDHPEYEALRSLKTKVEDVCELVNKSIVAPAVTKPINKRRKESTTPKTLLEKLKRTPKAEIVVPQDEDFTKAYERYNNDFLELQVVLRDIENYSRITAEFVNQFLKYLAAIELVVRSGGIAKPTPLELKWIGFSSAMSTLEKKYLATHVSHLMLPSTHL